MQRVHSEDLFLKRERLEEATGPPPEETRSRLAQKAGAESPAQSPAKSQAQIHRGGSTCDKVYNFRCTTRSQGK
ncbi:hypothetical protein V1478_014647, partial [Vespula squamosa]